MPKKGKSKKSKVPKAVKAETDDEYILIEAKLGGRKYVAKFSAEGGGIGAAVETIVQIGRNLMPRSGLPAIPSTDDDDDAPDARPRGPFIPPEAPSIEPPDPTKSRRMILRKNGDEEKEITDSTNSDSPAPPA